jgi:hypothetical protein
MRVRKDSQDRAQSTLKSRLGERLFPAIWLALGTGGIGRGFGVDMEDVDNRLVAVT